MAIVPRLSDIALDTTVLLSLEPEELAGVLLQYLNSLPDSERGQLNRYNFSLPHTFEGYPQADLAAVSHAFMEAWVWLEREGLIAPKPGEQGEWVFITRRGRRLRSAEQLKAYQRANLLPRTLLHPLITEKIWASFLRGDYDTAIFQAFREVEIAVRKAGRFQPTDLGTDLMRKAFDQSRGPLRDADAPSSERQAVSALFAGALGLYKNPHSHRSVLVEARKAVEIILLASHLLYLIDERSNPDRLQTAASRARGLLPDDPAQRG